MIELHAGDLLPAIRRVERLVDLARLGLDREAERGYLRDIVDAVVNHLDTPFVVINALLNDAEVILAGHGPLPAFIAEAGGTPLEWAFCQSLVVTRQPFTVEDLAIHPMFRDNPLVTVGGIRAYAGAPLISRTGQVLGGICGLDLRPRPFVAAEVEFLSEMAAEVVERLEASAQAG